MPDTNPTETSDDNVLYLMLSPPEQIHAMNIAVVKKYSNRDAHPLLLP